MSENSRQSSKKDENGERTSSGPTIKIAPADGRLSRDGADPGPGDLSAAPSEAPQLVELPPPPVSSAKSLPATSRLPTVNGQPVGGASTASTRQSSAGLGAGSNVASSPGAGNSSSRLKSASQQPELSQAASTGSKSQQSPQLSSLKAVSRSARQSQSVSPDASEASQSPATPDSGASEQQEPTESGGETSAATQSPHIKMEGGRKKKKGKKTTKFRYHKRVSVKAHGKTDPAVIMDKVNEKDHKAGITVDKLDPQELMRRAGIEGKEGTHWRIRLRQTKRTTKNGKTVTETRVAYRDSEGKSSVKTIEGDACKKCCKKMEECECEQS